eukprot:6558673-Lingulodinium_polyedra.AAC.1
MVICIVGSLRSAARSGGGTMFRAFFPMATAPKPALRKQGAVERKRAAWGRAPATTCMHTTCVKPMDTRSTT